MSRGWPVRPGASLPGCYLVARALAGFTLIEMMVTLMIAGILFFVALPGYQYAVIKSTRAAARAILLDVTSRQEQFFVNHKRYAVTLESLGLPQDTFIDGQGEAVGQQSAAYHVSLELLDGVYSGVQAAPLNRQAADSVCMTMSLSSIGVRSVSGSLALEPARCW
jgi:type IV pilus assembly protein PilE